jgi:hypothetical protein
MIAQAKFYQSIGPDELNWKQEPGRWSILECLEHLNLYGDFYLVEIERRIIASDNKPESNFQSGLLGNYFANSMLPKDGKIKKMKTFKDKDPANSNLPMTTIDRFLKQQKRMIELLELAREVNLNKVKTSITIPVIKLKLGDTFRFVIYHNQRHMIQADQVHQELLMIS